MTTRDPLDYGWWLASRSAGIVAYLLLSLAVLLGLSMALRLGAPRTRVAMRVVHERVALLALGAIAAHGLLLLGDPWLKASLTGVLVPFTIGYRPVWTGIGILAGYLTAGLSLTFYLRRRIGNRRWRLAHRFIPIAWALAAIHVVGAGTDAVSLWLEIPIALTVALVIALLGERLLGGRPEPARAPLPALAAGRGPALAAGREATPSEPERLFDRSAAERDDTPAELEDARAPLWSHSAR
jgi:sulfoxide reductase heme-binding subunit YedZ